MTSRQKLRRAITTVLILLVTGVFLPVASEFFIKLAEEQGFYDQPSAKAASVLGTLATVTENWWFAVLLGFVAGGAFFMWGDYYLRRNRPEKQTFSESAPEPASSTPEIDTETQGEILKLLKEYKDDDTNADIEFASVPQRPLAETLKSIFVRAGWQVNMTSVPIENQKPDYWEGVHVWGRNKHLIEVVAAAFSKAGIKGVHTSLKPNPFSPGHPKWAFVEGRVKIRIGHKSL